jgi:N6-adenosine-specific RNA methylase IME4
MKLYKTIYADPPWITTAGRPLGSYVAKDGKQTFSTGSSNLTRPLSYPQMSVDDIAALPIRHIADRDAHLYIWVINKYLLQASSIITSWGFEYVTPITWAKTPFGGGLGGTYRNTSEHLLFCRRGRLKAKKKITGTWFHVKRQYINGKPCHSKKPDFFRHMIEDVSPGPYLELFAREQAAGWDVFGNQVNNSISLTAKP